MGAKGSMENKEYIYEPQTQKKKKKRGAWSLERVHNQKRYYDGKIFYGADRVMYTFVYDDEVNAPGDEAYERIPIKRDIFVKILQSLAEMASQVVESNGEYYILHLGY